MIGMHAYYPFLDSTKRVVREKGISSELDEKVIALAKIRVLSAIKHSRIQVPNYFTEKNAVDDIRSYAVSRLLISIINRKINAFVNAESARALEICRKNKDREFLMKELEIELDSDGCIDLNKFFAFGSHFSALKLANRIVENGKVKIEEHEIDVIIKEAIKNKVAEGLPIRESLISDEIRKALAPAVKEISLEISLRSPALGRQSRDIAPCMEKIIEELGSGAKVSHLKRWSLAVFLIKRGWDVEKIVDLFSTTPNFNKAVTKYQLEHIKLKGYSMPSCRTLISQGICTANCGIKNPLQYKKKSS